MNNVDDIMMDDINEARGLLDFFDLIDGVYSMQGRSALGFRRTESPKKRKSSIPAAKRKRRTAKKKRAKKSRKK